VAHVDAAEVPRALTSRGDGQRVTLRSRSPERTSGRVRNVQAPSTPFASIWFDCDSTLSTIEGVDELGRRRDASTLRAVEDLTARAMSGELPLAEVYAARLATLAPTRAECEAIGTRYVETLVPDARLVLDALRHLGKTVGIISGGLLPPVAELAAALGVDDDHVFAVPIEFAADGTYRAFDTSCPLARNGGKVELLDARPSQERPIAFVGDGMTDLEAAPVVDRFIGFGGVARRRTVEASAQHYALGPSLATVLPFLLTANEQSILQNTEPYALLFTDR
jgi:phosphoserine phosphatase